MRVACMATLLANAEPKRSKKGVHPTQVKDPEIE